MASINCAIFTFPTASSLSHRDASFRLTVFFFFFFFFFFHASIAAQGSGPCNPGRWCPAGSTGALGVSGCPVGFFCANGADRQQCRAGAYCPPNADQPVPCPSGRFCQTNGLSTVTGTCPGGYFCSPGSVQSMLSGCSPGFYCPAGSSTGLASSLSLYYDGFFHAPIATAIGSLVPPVEMRIFCIRLSIIGVLFPHVMID